MSTRINLGKISVPLDDYASQGNAILGIRDSGKSYTATGIAESLMDARIPIIAFDPIGIWRYLRVPGAGKGYEVVVAGGKQGDLPLTPRGAQEIVRAAMRENVSLVVDLYDLHLSKADWRTIVATSIRTLLYENGEHGLRHIFIEEAAEFCPQNVGGEQATVYAEVEKLARMGGNALLGYTLINQRAEQVNKAVLELCDCLILHRQKGRNSINALSKWLDLGTAAGGGEITKSLPMLAQGECWVWPAGSDTPVRTKVPAKRSFHPDRRARQAAPKGAAAVDVSGFVATMKGTLESLVKEAEENDPKRLRARIAELEREKAKQSAGTPVLDREALQEAERRGYAAGLATARATLRQAGDEISAINQPLPGLVRQLQESMTRFANVQLGLYNEASKLPVSISSSTKAVQENRTPPARLANLRNSASSGPGESMPKAERLVLTALAQYQQGRSKAQVAILTGYAVNGGGFNNAIGSLRSAGRVNGSGDRLEITQAGLDALGHFDPLPHGDELLQHWLRQLGKAEASALRVIVDAYPGAVSKEACARAAGYEPNGGGFNNALGRLRSLELVTGRGELRASEELFG